MVIGIEASNIRAGGGLTHLKELLKNYTPSEHDSVIVWSSIATLEQLPDKKWLKKVAHPFLNKNIIFRVIWLKFFLKKEVYKKNCDVLFSPGGLLNIEFPYVSMSQNMLVFDTIQQKQYGLSLTRFRLKILEYVQRKSFKNSNGVIFISNYAKNFISSKIRLHTPNTVIHHGISSRFNDSPRDQKPIEYYNNQPFKLLYISTIDFYKHQLELISAIKSLITDGINVELTLVGSKDPSYFSKIHDLIDGEKIKYLGVVPFENIHEIYRNSDGFIFSSSCENMPNILIEAMRSGLPIACSNSAPMPEFLKEYGFYFDPYSIQSINNTIFDFLHDCDRRKEYAEKAYTISGQYSWEKCANETFNFIKKAKNDKPS